jgi:membrane protease YdiL (CAAX protease family)
MCAICFGLLHWKSVFYIIIMFFIGLVWAFCCLVFLRRKQHPILYTALTHGCYNCLLFTLSALFI